MKKVCVIGLGYTGLPTAAMFAKHGLDVIGVDINPAIIELLSQGQTHIYEPGLPELVQQAVRQGSLRVSLIPEPSDAFIIEVPTPFKDEAQSGSATPGSQPGDKLADMSYVIAATESIVPVLQPGNLVVLESTSPPCTTTKILKPILERSGLKAGQDFYLAYTPERVLPGQILKELVENARVIGGIDPASAQAGHDLYSIFVTGEIIQTDATTAEMSKLMENTYRDVNIALANEFARLGERFGVDIWEAIAISNKHPRVKILNPGVGVGGHCISVDPWFLVEAAPDLSAIIRTARQVNDAQPAYVCQQIEARFGALSGMRIAALGLAYKPDVDDLRESPAVETVHLLQRAGAVVTSYEPYKLEARLAGLQTAQDLASALADAQLIAILVAHRPFKAVHPEQLSKLTAARDVFDAVNLWPVETWQAAGFRVYRLGGSRSPATV